MTNEELAKQVEWLKGQVSMLQGQVSMLQAQVGTLQQYANPRMAWPVVGHGAVDAPSNHTGPLLQDLPRPIWENC